MRHAAPDLRRRRRAVAFVSTALVAALPALALSRGQANAADVPEWKVSIGARGYYDPGDHVVVTADVSSNSFFEGDLEVETASGAVSSRHVEIAGGTTKTVSVVVSTSGQGGDVTIRLVDGNDVIISNTPQLRVADEIELVGVMPAVATRIGDVPEEARTELLDRPAQIVEIGDEMLALGPGALDVYDTILAASADIGVLDGVRLHTMLAWINRGGRLVLDDATPIATLPTEWQPGAAGYALAGRGEIRVSPGRVSQRQWAAIIEPSGSSVTDNVNMGGFVLGTDVQSQLAARAGVRLPSLSPLLVPLLLYWFAVSVVLFVVLKMLRRMTLAWVAIPLLALVTAAGVVAYGGRWRSTGSPTSATFVDSYPSGSSAQTSLMTFSRRGGPTSVKLPTGWHSDSEINPTFGADAVLRTIESDQQTEFSAVLEAGQVVSATFSGPSTATGLSITAEMSADGKNIVGTVTNGGTVTLYDVAVFGVASAVELDDLAPGDTATYEVKATAAALGASPADRVWDRRFDTNNQLVTTEGSLVEMSAWDLATLSSNVHAAGMVRVAGWTSERPGDASGLNNRTVLTTSTPINASATGSLAGAAVRAASVRSPFGMFGDGTGDPTFRYVIPPNTRPQTFELELPIGLDTVEFWNGSTWLEVSAKGRVVNVPTNAVRSGVVIVRLGSNEDFFFVDSTPTLRGAEVQG